MAKFAFEKGSVAIREGGTNQQTGQKQYVPHYYRQTNNILIVALRKDRQTDGRSDHYMPAFVGIKINIGHSLENSWNTLAVLTRKNAPPPGSHVFKPTGIIFELVQDIIGINHLTKFMKIGHHIRKNAPPLGSHVFQANVTIFELIQDIIETNLLTKFHEDWTINVASRE
ncbi:hypothetical protein DPMN_100423 [Dreissena polymorpha]|uniref:Uncharacterized protein n=1 Tax=Dreissena polymorpha TaxID=45954 RepID=A0A9D4LHI6_DREPO|nr:hypothetical protein DPMN_100423 [Dreissena polymorpha]